MKTGKSISKQLFVSAFVLFFGVFVFTACHKDKDNTTTNTNNRTFSISGTADGGQVVPALTDTGTATITGTYSQSTNQLITVTSWNKLSGAPTGGGFYSGTAGTNGTLIGSGWTLGSGLSGAGSFNDTLTLTTDQAAALTTGTWYFTLATAANPTGEVRGQITATAQ